MTSKKPTKKTTTKKAPAKKAASTKTATSKKKPAAVKQFVPSSSLVTSLVDDVKDNVVYAADVKNPVVKKKFFRWFSR